MVFQESADPRHAFLVRAHHPPVTNHLAREELSVSYRQPGEVISTKCPRRGGDAPEHQPVPGGENLLVAAGPDAARACVVENSPRPGENCVERLLIHFSACGGGGTVRRHEEDILSLKVSAARHAIINLESGGIGAEE